MNKTAKVSMVLVTIAALVCIPLHGTAWAHESYALDEMSAETMTVDALLVRPLGLVSMVLGSALFVVSLPFSATGGNIKEVSQKMVAEPTKFTFTRPLGDFSELD